jgi:hypothetical protein
MIKMDLGGFMLSIYEIDSHPLMCLGYVFYSYMGYVHVQDVLSQFCVPISSLQGLRKMQTIVSTSL